MGIQSLEKVCGCAGITNGAVSLIDRYFQGITKLPEGIRRLFGDPFSAVFKGAEFIQFEDNACLSQLMPNKRVIKVNIVRHKGTTYQLLEHFMCFSFEERRLDYHLLTNASQLSHEWRNRNIWLEQALPFGDDFFAVVPYDGKINDAVTGEFATRCLYVNDCEQC